MMKIKGLWSVYKGVMVDLGPSDASLMGSLTIHRPKAQKTVAQHLEKFWTLTCFDVSH